VNRFTILIFLLSFFRVDNLSGQHTPEIINYKIADYKAHQQNWSISQHKSGNMYFANTDGLLSFNGNAWNLEKLRSNKIIRSVCVVGDKIYTGAYGEIGYWTNNTCGEMYYQSLVPLIKDNAISKEEIWNIVSINDKVYFQSFSVLMVYDGQSFEKIMLPGSVMFLHIVGPKMVIQALDHGLYEIKKDKSVHFIPGTEIFRGKIVTGICPFPAGLNDHWIISTNSHGLYVYQSGKISKWVSDLEDYFAEIQINKMMVNKAGLLILGSIRAGVFIFKQNGDLVYHVNSSNGLQNNTVLALFEDKDQNLWIGLDKGIGLLKTNVNRLLYHDHSGILGTVYTTAVLDSFFYVGTNQGVYYINQRRGKLPGQDFNFKLLKGTQGQVWQLKNLGNAMLCGHNDGTFIIKKNSAHKISDITGGWYSEFLDGGDQNTILQGSYTGMAVFKKGLYDEWKLSHKISGYNEPVKKFIKYGQNEIWVTGPNTGLSKLKTDSLFTKIIEVKQYGTAEGIVNEGNLDINFLNGNLKINDGQNHYYYDELDDNFKKDTYLNRFKNGYFIRVIDDSLWCRVYNDSLILMSGNAFLYRLNHSLNKDYHCVSKQNNGQFVFSLNEGYDICYSPFNSENISINKIVPEKIYLIHNGECILLKGNTIPDLPADNNKIRIHFHDFLYEAGKMYDYRLLPSDSEWKTASDVSYLEFNNLSPGSYSLDIRRNEDGEKTTILFNILPPFYKSIWAGFIYILLLGFLLYLFKRYFDTKLTKEKLKLEVENDRLLREHKYQLENDRLIQDNIIKNKELANATMHLIQKNELLQEIKEELIDVRKTGDHTLTTKDFQNLMKLINENMTVEDDKNLFEYSFNEVHESFIKKLKHDFPELSVADLKLAAYLKMNLTSKEIAPLFNISIRGLENKRYRLRKKLNLPNDANLLSFFIGYS